MLKKTLGIFLFALSAILVIGTLNESGAAILSYIFGGGGSPPGDGSGSRGSEVLAKNESLAGTLAESLDSESLVDSASQYSGEATPETEVSSLSSQGSSPKNTKLDSSNLPEAESSMPPDTDDIFWDALYQTFDLKATLTFALGVEVAALVILIISGGK